MSKIDTSFVFDHKVVIMCSSKSEANKLYSALISDYPNDNLQEYLLPKIRQFMIETDGYGTCYRVQKLNSGFDIGYADKTWYEGKGYRVLDFKTLIIHQDYGEFESGFCSSDAALSALF